MKKAEIILTVILALVTVAIAVTIIIVAVNGRKEPDDMSEPTTGIDTVAPNTDDDTTVPPPTEVTTEEDNGTDVTEPESGEIALDIGNKNDNGHEDAPGIVGDIDIIPGLKEVSDEKDD